MTHSIVSWKKSFTTVLPRTLFGQLLLALCAGLIAAQAAGIWLTLNDRARFGEGLLGGFAAQRIAGIISILEEAEPGERQRLVRALNVPPTHISLDVPWGKPATQQNEDAAAFAERLAQELEKPVVIQILTIKRAEPRRHDETNGPRRDTEQSAHISGNRKPDGSGSNNNSENGNSADSSPLVSSALVSSALVLPASVSSTSTSTAASKTPNATNTSNTTSRLDSHASHRNRPMRPVLLVIGQALLNDGTIVTFSHSLPEPGLDGPLHLLGLLAISGISVAFLSGWAVRRLTLPLASLADAATGLARNLERAPLPESGPLEIAQAARAFNVMQREIRRYLETRAQALAAVSHDLRLPITRLRLRMERIEEGDLKIKMENDLSEMETMIDSTLAFLRAGSSTEKASMMDINAFIESVAEDMVAVGAHITQQGEAAQPILARPQALRRCLINLLDNAQRYGGGEINISTIDLGKTVEIHVEDRGNGLPEADLERVFEPYVRMESSRAKHTGGMGLGLAIARAIARSHEGDVKLVNRVGGGTIVILTLPRQGEK